MKKYLELIRIKHWIKNLLIFIPMFTAKIFNYSNLFTLFLGWLSFSFVSSFIYIINDIRDIEKDKMHPRKKKRPIPSGEIKKSTAIAIAVVLLTLAVLLSTYLSHNLFNLASLYLLVYLVLNLLYSYGLKNIAIVDVAILAFGFVLRIYYGASLVNVKVSHWLFLTIMYASLFLGFGKRRKELEANKAVRKVLNNYNEKFLIIFQYLSLSLTLAFYSLWAIEQNADFLIYSIPILTLIFMRYCFIIENSDEGDPITIIYGDISLVVLVLIYGLFMLFLFI